MTKEGGSFDFYRQCYDEVPRQSIEPSGISDHAVFERVVADPQTVRLELPEATLPLLTPLRHLALPSQNWLNPSFYRQLTAEAVPVMHYSHLSNILSKYPGEYKAVLEKGLQSLAADQGLLVFEYADREADAVNEDLNTLIDGSAVTGQDAMAAAGKDPRHYHYANRAIPEGKAVISGELSLYETYQKGLEDGEIEADHITMVAEISGQDAESIWQFYEPVHAELSEVSPANAGLTKNELTEVLGSPEFVKLVYRAGATIVNLCMVTDVENCDWMNRGYYEANFPEAYNEHRIIFGMGLLNNPSVKRPLAPSVHTMSRLAEIVRLSGLETIFSFTCNAASNRYVPWLSQRALRSAGLQVDFSEPIGQQIFRALRLFPK